MKSLRVVAMVTVALLMLSLTVASALAQAPGVQTLTVVGKVAKDQTLGDYYIQGEKPPEVYRIVNQNPAVLESYAKSGKSVTIETQVVMGDNLAIQKINGKKYQEGQGK
jgi:hypothetical protein